MAYEVKSGDTIYDATFNVSGSLAGVDAILELNTSEDAPPVDWKTMEGAEEPPFTNRMESYTPQLVLGDILNTDGIDVQNLDAVNARDFNSSVAEPEAVEAEITELVELLRN